MSFVSRSSVIVSSGMRKINIFALESQAVINLDEREICKDVRIQARDFSKLQSF